VVSEAIGNFSLLGVELGHCADGLGNFWGVRQFFVCRGLIWGTVWMVLGGYGGVRQFSIVGG
jgi:hypothetical protein